MKRGSFVFVVVGVGSGLDVFELVDFPKGGGFLGPVKLVKALGGCRLEKVVVFGDVEGEFPVAVDAPVLGLVHVESVPGELILLTIVVSDHKLDRILQIKWLAISESFFGQVDWNVLIALLNFPELNT